MNNSPLPVKSAGKGKSSSTFCCARTSVPARDVTDERHVTSGTALALDAGLPVKVDGSAHGGAVDPASATRRLRGHAGAGAPSRAS